MKRKILKGLLSLAVALALWIYVVTVVSPSADRVYNNVPVVLQGESLLKERGLMITTQDIPSVSVHLEGNRSDLDKLNNSNITLTADLSRIYDAGTHSLRFSSSYPGDVASGAISVLSQDPVSITVEVEERVTKQVPVEVDYTGELAEGILADVENKELSVQEVEISGPKSVVSKIATARINVNLDERTESISEEFTYTLCNKKGKAVDAKLITTDTEKVNLSLRIARIKEVALDLQIVDGGGATKDTTQIVLSPETIRVSGSDTQLENIEKVELGTINLGEVLEDSVFTFPIKLPEGVVNETGVTEATATVRLKDLETKTLKVSNFKLVNVPKGMNAKLITQELEVQMRGSKEQIDRLKKSDITVQVDFANAKTGTVKINAQINSSVSGVGAVGTYTVSATVKAAK